MVSELNDLNSTDDLEQRVSFIEISVLPAFINGHLAEFFEATAARNRLYLLLLSLWRHQSVRTANAMAFDLFLALVPMLGVAGWGASLVLHQAPQQPELRAFSSLAPGNLNEFLGRHFDALAASHLAPLAAVVGWWLSSSAFNTMIDVFEETFECAPRNWLRRRLISLGFAFLGMAFLGMAGTLGFSMAMAPGVVSAVINLLDQSGLFRLVLGGIAYLCMTAFLALLFRYAIRRPGRKRRIWPGAFTASTAGAVASIALGYYTTHIARYALFYGGLAVIVVVLVWLWLWSSAILVGAEINVALEDVQTSKKLKTTDAH